VAKVHTRFIQGLLDMFAPSIYEGQEITAYVGENISPYVIQGDNLSVQSQLASRLFSLEALKNTNNN